MDIKPSPIDYSRHGGISRAWFIITMTQSAMSRVSPCIDTTLRKQSFVEFMPSIAVMLDNRLVRDAESASSDMAPVRRVESNRWLLEGFAGAAQSEKALRVEVREDGNKDI